MPLDDVYIHFQYAKQLAHGQPYVYNPGLPPTSGATSFLYPYVLALGYLIGFQGLNLGLWVMIVGAVALAGSAYLVYRIGKELEISEWIAILFAIIFVLAGPISWHFMSGMETGLVILFTLATLHAFVTRQTRYFVVAATLLALIRPETGILTLIAVVLFASMSSHSGKTRSLLLLPILTIGVQPLVNLLLTGTPIATGNQAKSLLGLIPPDRDVIIGRIIENFVRMWRDVLFPQDWLSSLTTGVIGLGVLALIGLVGLLVRGRKLIVLLLVLWLISGTAAIATLDTAFWHFRRYQMPFVALLFPMASVGLVAVFSSIRMLSRLERNGRYGLPIGELTLVLWMLLMLLGAFIIFSFVDVGLTSFTYGRWYAANVNSIYQQPLQMARWLAANTPVDATVAVHDVGMMRYIGNRTTIDMVGLTTPGAADYWRNGPGAVAQFLMKERPDYIAAYTDARGLSYLADTGIYGELLVGFPVDYDESSNVALAGHFQAIYEPEWSAAEHTSEVLQPGVKQYLSGLELVDSIDVGDVETEESHQYHWSNLDLAPGFVSEVYEQGYLRCVIKSCTILDAGRRINGNEAFTLATHPNEDLVLVTRLHPLTRGTYDVYVGEQLVDTVWIPEIPGTWLEVSSLIPSEYITSTRTVINIIPQTPNSFYMPYYHWAWQGSYTRPHTTFTDKRGGSFQNGEITVWTGIPRQAFHSKTPQIFFDVIFHSDGKAQGDYKFFAHVYNDIHQPPIAQVDTYALGTELPGNWLPGDFADIISLDLSGISSGTYQVAIGMYEPLMNERLKPDSGDDEFGRLFIGEVELKGSDTE